MSHVEALHQVVDSSIDAISLWIGACWPFPVVDNISSTKPGWKEKHKP